MKLTKEDETYLEEKADAQFDLPASVVKATNLCKELNITLEQFGVVFGIGARQGFKWGKEKYGKATAED